MKFINQFKQHLWRNLFISLLVVNICFGIVFISLLFINNHSSYKDKTKLENDSEVIFSVEMKKDELNKYMKNSLDSKIKDGDIDINLTLDDYLRVEGAVPIFSSKIQFLMNFEPEVLKNGDVFFHFTSMQVGEIKLPPEFFLKRLKKFKSFPPWIEILPNDKGVYAKITQIQFQDKYYLKAKEFDLRQDKIKFDVIIPNH